MWKANPKLKVVLGVRDSAKVWYKSAKSTILTETGKPEIDAIFDRFLFTTTGSNTNNISLGYTRVGMSIT